MIAVLIAAYFVMLAVAVVCILMTVRTTRAAKAAARQHDNERAATKQWAQRLSHNADKEAERVEQRIKEVQAESFNAGRADMLAELKERVDRGEVSVQILSTPVVPPTPTAPVPQTTRIPVQ